MIDKATTRKVWCKFCGRQIGMSGIQAGYPAPHKLTEETSPGGAFAPGDWCPGAMRSNG